MYPVSDAFLAAVKQPVVEYSVSGMIGSVSFGEANIVSGSFKISNQCTDSSDVVLGSVYVGQLESTFVNVNIDYTDWIGKVITPILSLKVGPTSYEGIALGTFTVAEAVHTADGVQVVAYDNMCKFDRKLKKANFRHTMTPIQIAQQICSDCGVTFGNTVAECQALVNYDETIDIFGIYGKYKDFNNDIDTYRDLLFWCAQTLGAFATINRDGELVLKAYSNDVIDTISESHRLSGAQFEDYITNYTGIYVADMRWGTESYYGYDATALTAEIALVDGEIDQVDSDLVQLEIDYAEGHITEEEYKARKKDLTQQKKQLQKRLNWLNKALAKAQAGADGSFMDLGENPLLQDDTYAKRERERRAVLSALDMISYTPFQCDSIFGAHYDLGDVIYFTGGHAGSDGVFACIMSYEFTLHQAYTMQGFGVNPAMENTRSLSQKTATMANANAMTAKEISSGYDAPAADDGKENDVYVKYADKTVYSAKYPIKYHGWADIKPFIYDGQQITFTRPEGIIEAREFKFDEETGYYSFVVNGYVFDQILSNENPHIASNGHYCDPVFQIEPDSVGTYKFSCDAKWNCEALSGNVSIGLTNPTHYDYIGSTPATVTEWSAARDEWVHYEWEKSFTDSDFNSPLYMWFTSWWPMMPSSIRSAYFECVVKNLRIEKVINNYTHETDTGVTAVTDHYVDAVYVKEQDANGNLFWKNIEYVAGADTSALSGLALNYKRWLNLTPEVMRALLQHKTPQTTESYNRFCVRVTGKPAAGINISLQNNTGWLNKSIKKDSEGAFTLKSGGTVSSGAIEYCAYKITGLTAGQKYYFNFKVNFKDGTHFNDDYDKGLGLVFNTTGVINTDDWTGDPDTFDAENLYYSAKRTTAGYFANFGFKATASTMYMCVVVADIFNGDTSSLTLSKMVISKTERELIRNFYIFDLVANDWLPYKPWGTGADDGGDEGISTLGDLDDVQLDNLQNNQVLSYNGTAGEWQNRSLGTAAEKDVTSAVATGNTNLPTSGAVKDAIDAAVSSVYKPAGSKTVAQMTSALLVAENLGNVYNMSDSGTTTADFVEGAGHPIDEGDNVVIVDVGSAGSPSYKFDLLSGIIDLSDYYDKGEVDDLLDAKVDVADVGVANGIAELDANGDVPKAELPSDVVYDNPTFSEAGSRANIASGESFATILGKIKKFFTDLKAVAFSGSYSDLSDTPTIPTVNNGTLTIQKNGSTVATFTANQSGNASANITVPTKVSELQNDSGYATETEVEGYKTVTGKYITITDGAELPAKNYSLTLSPVQEGSGDPSPSNVRPIHGADEVGVRVCGKNLFDKTDATLLKEGFLNTETFQANSSTRSVVLPCFGNTTYAVSKTLTTRFAIAYSTTEVTFGSPIKGYVGNASATSLTITTGSDAKYLIAYFYNSSSDTKSFQEVLDSMQIEKGETATEYEAFNGHSTTITLPSTVYGGSVDSDTGVLTVTHEIVSFDSFTGWSEYNGAYYKGFSGYKKGTSGIVNISNKLKYGGQNTGISALINKGRGCFGFRYDANDHIQIYPPEDLTDFFPVTIAYELATPITIQLTPFPQTLLEGVNNLWAEMKESSTFIDNAQQSLSYQPQNIVGQLRQEIEAKPDSFAQLSDTSFSNLSNGQIPKWNSTSQKWENANESGGGGLPAWTVLGGLGYNDDVELPATFSELLVVVANGDGYKDLLSSSIFIADVADFDVSAERFPVLQIPIYLQGSTMWSILEGSVSNNKRIYTLKGYQNSIAVIYYR